MKTPLLLTIITLATLPVFAADTPAAILKDYQSSASAALSKVNDTLEKAAVPLVAALVKSGDTTGAADLQAQLKAKTAGEPVANPQPSATALFKSYDAARLKALEPAQKSAIKRIEYLLTSADGKKMDVVTELGKVRAEIEGGKTFSASEWLKTWSIVYEKNGSPNGAVVFNSDGTAIYTSKAGFKTPGSWTANPKNNTLKVTFPADEWVVVSKQSGVEMQSKAITHVTYLVPQK